MALLITDTVAKQLLAMSDAINMTEFAVRELHEGKAENHPQPIIFEAIESGALTWARACELGEAVTEAKRRRNRREITVFKNNAMAVEFTALAARVFELACTAGSTEEVPAHYFEELKLPLEGRTSPEISAKRARVLIAGSLATS